MRITKLFGALALGGILAAGVAYAAATSSTSALPAPQAAEATTAGTPVTATWAMGEKTFSDISASYSIEGAFSASNLSYVGVTTKGTRKVTYADGSSLTTTTYACPANTNTRNNQVYVDYSLTPSKSFSISKIAFDWMAAKTGNGRLDIELIIDGVVMSVAKAQVPTRFNGNDSDLTADFHKEFNVSASAAKESVILRFYFYSSDTSAREMGFANVAIFGALFEEGEEVPETAPAGWAVIPGALNKIEESTNNTEAGWTKGGSIGYDSQDGQFGSIKNGGWCSTNFFCDKAGVYELVVPFKWDQSNGQNDDIHIQITDQTTGNVEIDQHYNYTGGRTDQTIGLEGVMARGRKTIKFTFTSPGTGYITNIMAPTFKWVSEEYSDTPAEGIDHAPGQFNEITEATWTCDGGCKVESGNNPHNIGYVGNGSAASTKFYCDEAGVYSIDCNFTWYANPSTVTFSVKNRAGNVEAKGEVAVNGTGVKTIYLDKPLTVGTKTLTISFAGGGGYLANFVAPQFNRLGDVYASIKDVTVEGIANSAAEGYDWNFLLPESYAGENVVLNVAAENGAVTANGEPVADGKVTVATPAAGQETIVNLSLAANEDAYAAQTEYAVRLFHIGDVQVASLTVDGKDVTDAELLAALNSEAAAATLAGNCYTAVPAVSATMLDGSVANAVVTLEGTTATATFSGKAGDKTKTFTLAVEGVHTYTAAENDKKVEITYDVAFKGTDAWSNGLYTLRNGNDGYGSWFKMSREKVIWEIPSNIIVKQMVMKSLKENYDHVSSVISVVSGDAKVYLPTNNQFVIGDATAYDLVINFENHMAGTPIEISFNSQGQPMAWFEFIVEEQKLQGEPTVQSGSNTQVDTKNHCVVTLDFGRKMQECVAEYNGKTVKADGGTTTLKFSLWELAWGEETVLTIPAGAAKDVDGNTNSEAITYTVAVAQQPTTVGPVEAITYVSNVDELKAAVASVMASNNTADAPRHIIFLKNGDYDLGTSTAKAPILHLNKAYNVSIIGEDRDGVVVHGSITGISYPVFSTRNSTNIYMENFTIRNDLDWGCFDSEGNGDGVGVGVAHYGGKRDIMVNMRLQSNQDTQVTGEQGYYYNCEIHGSVDFICGGGNHFYDHCTFVTTRKGSVVAAPSTSAAQKWGYVFSYCTIKGISGYNLGRPWDNEPRCYWLNTTMEANCSANGWDKMGNLVTHFYEYNSMDASGNALDLSGRGNSPSSTNKYNPVLTAEEAAEFTVENVLGGDDSWLATEETVGEIAAPEGVAYEKQTETANAHIWWYPVEGAAGYLIYNNGEYLGYAPGDHDHFDLATNTSYKKVASRTDEEGFSYTIRAISPNGTMSAHSFAMTSQNPTGIETVGADAAAKVEYYNLQGQPVAEGYRGAVIKVETAADGSRSVSKAFLD